MRSKVHFKSHPLHPILVSFPIAFFTGVLLAHMGALFFDEQMLYSTAWWLNIAGVLFGLLAAIPGFIDFLYVVPPKSSGKKRAAKHGIINATMLVIFTVAFFYRSRLDANEYVVLAMEIAGIVLLGIAGWLGGTLVYRNQVGVDHRYANAGKWSEAYFDEEHGEVEVASAGELKVNAMKLLHFKLNRIVLARTDKKYVAFEDRCTHRGGPLADGALACGIVQCPWHGSQFDVETGNNVNGPAKESIRTFSVREEGGKIFLKL